MQHATVVHTLPKKKIFFFLLTVRKLTLFNWNCSLIYEAFKIMWHQVVEDRYADGPVVRLQGTHTTHTYTQSYVSLLQEN